MKPITAIKVACVALALLSGAGLLIWRTSGPLAPATVESNFAPIVQSDLPTGPGTLWRLNVGNGGEDLLLRSDGRYFMRRWADIGDMPLNAGRWNASGDRVFLTPDGASAAQVEFVRETRRGGKVLRRVSRNTVDSPVASHELFLDGSPCVDTLDVDRDLCRSEASREGP